MHKDRSQRGAREHIAQLAARLMAEDHIPDFALAKRKAARQLNLPDGKNLPTNQEVEIALRQYRDLYQPEHGEIVAALRRKAVDAMLRFDAFKPYLVGSVLNGLAGPHSDINLIIYSDNPKSVELFCLNNDIAYRLDSRRSEEADYPTLTFDMGETLVRLSVRQSNDERTAGRNLPHAPERARLSQVQNLIESKDIAGIAAG